MRLVVGMSGASGVIYGIRMLEVLQGIDEVETHLIMSRAARQTITLESDWDPGKVELLADVVHKFGDVTAGPASGSFRLDAMVVVPCSMKTMASIAYSFSDNLLTRGGGCRAERASPSDSVPRETPLHLGHLRTMVQLAEMGAVVAPPMPAFYHRPATVDDVVNQTVGRLLDLLGLTPAERLFERWRGGNEESAQSEPGG